MYQYKDERYLDTIYLDTDKIQLKYKIYNYIIWIVKTKRHFNFNKIINYTFYYQFIFLKKIV